MSGGQAVNILSGGDLTLRGAVVDGNRVTADVGGSQNSTHRRRDAARVLADLCVYSKPELEVRREYIFSNDRCYLQFDELLASGQRVPTKVTATECKKG
ncbi:hypothetical protein C7T35_03645 [Variovorax sp. WS11]|nr:hypothetical protein C7T35_03645 [Variovorax sp. WS11]